MTAYREFLVITPDGSDYGRDADSLAAMKAARRLGPGARVVGLDENLCRVRGAADFYVVPSRTSNGHWEACDASCDDENCRTL